MSPLHCPTRQAVCGRRVQAALPLGAWAWLRRVVLRLGLLAGLGLGAGMAWAQAPSRLAAQALDCAAVWDVLAQQHGADAALSARLRQGAQTFMAVYAQELGSAAQDETRLQAQRDAARAAWRADWPQRGAQFVELGVLCGAWAEGFFAQGARFDHVPVYPKVVPMAVRQHYHGLAQDAWVRWLP